MSVLAKNVYVGGSYRVISIPHFRNPNFFTPDIGSVGECIWLEGRNNTMCVGFGKDNATVLGLEHLEEVNGKARKIDDTFLVTAIQENPERVLRLIKGISKMTKHPHFLNFLDRAELPQYSKERIRVELNPKMTRQVPEPILCAMFEPDRNGTIKYTDKYGIVQYIPFET